MNEAPNVLGMESKEEEKPIASLESIKKMSENLKAKIAEAKKQKEEGLNKQVSDREAMLAELKQTGNGLFYFLNYGR